MTPLKTLILPQLELLGALTSVHLSDYLVLPQAIPIQITHLDWQSNCTVLAERKENWSYLYINIMSLRLRSSHWHWDSEAHTDSECYCPTANNLGNMITRSISAQKLASSSLWKNCPPWLPNDNIWPQWSSSTIFHLHVAARRICIFTSKTFANTNHYSPQDNWPQSLQQLKKIVTNYSLCLQIYL